MRAAVMLVFNQTWQMLPAVSLRTRSEKGRGARNGLFRARPMRCWKAPHLEWAIAVTLPPGRLAISRTDATLGMERPTLSMALCMGNACLMVRNGAALRPEASNRHRTTVAGPHLFDCQIIYIF